VKADVPGTGYGVGALLGVDDRARVARMVRPPGEQVVLWDYWPVVDGVRTMEGAAEPGIGNEGRLRLKRTGATLHYLWSPDDKGDDFHEVHATEYGYDDTKFFTFVAESSGQPCAVDVRVLEFQIRPCSTTVSILRWTALGIAAAGAVGAGGLLALSSILRRMSRLRQARVTAAIRDAKLAGATDAEPEPDRVEVAADAIRAEQPAAVAVRDPILLQCPKCAKRVKVSARAAGKKVKCPGCGVVFVASVA
jgi:hypothetical protein